jgi:hypothetical protein
MKNVTIKPKQNFVKANLPKSKYQPNRLKIITCAAFLTWPQRLNYIQLRDLRALSYPRTTKAKTENCCSKTTKPAIVI